MSDGEGHRTHLKTESPQEGSFSSVDSSPEPDEQAFTQESAPILKRKGGRKPIYATSEERKQRNRQAQAAFRERRTEYIKQLETTIKHHEDTLQSLQQSQRSSADECLMLRYKNSLLERILLEKGIDIQAELRSHGEPASSVHSNASPSTGSRQSPLQRAVTNRQRTRKSTLITEESSTQPQPLQAKPVVSHSPQVVKPHSARSSPLSSKSPGFPTQGGIVPTPVDLDAQQQQYQILQWPQPPHKRPKIDHQDTRRLTMALPGAGAQVMTPNSTVSSTSHVLSSINETPSNYYPSPWRTHIEQLEQEYDAHADMLDEDLEEPPDAPAPFSQLHHQPYSSHPVAMNLHNQPSLQQTTISHFVGTSVPGSGEIQQGLGAYDLTVDPDPFELPGGMHYPPPYNYQGNPMRR